MPSARGSPVSVSRDAKRPGPVAPYAAARPGAFGPRLTVDDNSLPHAPQNPTNNLSNSQTPTPTTCIAIYQAGISRPSGGRPPVGRVPRSDAT